MIKPHPLINVDSIIDGEKSSSASVNAIPSTVVATLILGSNPYRKSAFITNDSICSLYLKFGGVGSLVDYTVKMPKHSYYEVPAPIFTGPLYGVWDSQDGQAMVTEFI